MAPEPESPALYQFLRSWPERVSSALARVELLRAVRRSAATLALRRRAEQILARLTLVLIDDPVLHRAAGLDPAGLRSLDAIHLATALSLGKDLGGFVSYDQQLLLAAAAAGLETMAPR